MNLNIEIIYSINPDEKLNKVKITDEVPLACFAYAFVDIHIIHM